MPSRSMAPSDGRWSMLPPLAAVAAEVLGEDRALPGLHLQVAAVTLDLDRARARGRRKRGLVARDAACHRRSSGCPFIGEDAIDESAIAVRRTVRGARTSSRRARDHVSGSQDLVFRAAGETRPTDSRIRSRRSHDASGQRRHCTPPCRGPASARSRHANRPSAVVAADPRRRAPSRCDLGVGVFDTIGGRREASQLDLGCVEELGQFRGPGVRFPGPRLRFLAPALGVDRP